MSQEKGVGTGIVQEIKQVFTKAGKPGWIVKINNFDYYDSKGDFKELQGQEVDFEWQKAANGRVTFIDFKGSRKPATSTPPASAPSGSRYGKSPEEVEAQRKSFALAYAKDQVNSLVSSTVQVIGSEGLKQFFSDKEKYFSFLETLRNSAAELTIKTARMFEGYLAPPDDDVPF